MEDLTKQQIILLTLLVSFVTSIATGIVTVSLMDQAPRGVTQTINRVVERTVEKVIPIQTNTKTEQITTVVKEADLAVEAVKSNEKSFVRIYEKPKGANSSSNVFSRFGVVVSKDGEVITDGYLISSYMDYTAKFSDDKSYLLTSERFDTATGLAIFKVAKDDKDANSFIPAAFGDSDTLRLGQTVISLSGKDSDSVALGIVSNLVWVNIGTSTTSTTASTSPRETKKINQGIFTDIRAANDEFYGNPLITLSGTIVGMKMHFSASNKGDYLPSNAINNLMTSLPAPSLAL